MTKIKICGLQEAQHVAYASELGVDYIGFVFAPSSRQVSIERAKKLREHVGKEIKVVGVFVNPSETFVQEVIREVSLDIVQLHGEEEVALSERLAVPVWKAVSVRALDDIEQSKHFPCERFVYDAPGRAYRGGSGETFDWSLMQDVPNEYILAGGLHAGNVELAIQQLNPWGVDVSSGVEREGRKDEERMREFVRAVRQMSEGENR